MDFCAIKDIFEKETILQRFKVKET